MFLCDALIAHLFLLCPILDHKEAKLQNQRTYRRQPQRQTEGENPQASGGRDIVIVGDDLLPVHGYFFGIAVSPPVAALKIFDLRHSTGNQFVLHGSYIMMNYIILIRLKAMIYVTAENVHFTRLRIQAKFSA